MHTFKGLNSSIWPIAGTLTGTTTLGQSGSGSNGTKGVFHIPQSSRTGTSPSDCLVSYAGHSFVERGSYSTAEVQLAYSTAFPVNLTV